MPFDASTSLRAIWDDSTQLILSPPPLRCLVCLPGPGATGARGEDGARGARLSEDDRAKWLWPATRSLHGMEKTGVVRNVLMFGVFLRRSESLTTSLGTCGDVKKDPSSNLLSSRRGRSTPHPLPAPWNTSPEPTEPSDPPTLTSCVAKAHKRAP